METQFGFIVDLAKVYKEYSELPDKLYSEINQLPRSIVQEIYTEYGSLENDFGPVKFLRAEIARQLLDGVVINEELVTEIKARIINKKLDSFSHLPEAFLEKLNSYRIKSKDMFTTWKNPWTVFHVFFYRNEKKRVVKDYLEQIAKDVLNRLELIEYKAHVVDFQGPSNYGSTRCWVALYPATNETHENCYQLFMSFESTPQAGMYKGSAVKSEKESILKNVNTYEEVVSCLSELKSEILRNNEDLDVHKVDTDVLSENATPYNGSEKGTVLGNSMCRSKNIILYGPPGTGKTYNSIDKAVEIASPEKYNMEDSEVAHMHNKEVFDELRKQGQIEFVTFHQNYSYEDFIVGIRPDIADGLNGEKNLIFTKNYGIFYKIAERAKENYLAHKEGPILSVQEMVNNLMERLENGEKIELRTSSTQTPFTIEYSSDSTIRLIYSNGNSSNSLSVDTLLAITSGKEQFDSSLKIYYYPLKEYLLNKRIGNSGEKVPLKNYVLIIDEINRANISRVFGELITLIEDDKRIEGKNELRVTLPNGETDFGIPQNLYIIGTMNTADKSIALIDIALRRRFEFIGNYPKYDKCSKEANKLLEQINNVIYIKKNKSADNLVGHAYFMKDETIEVVLKTRVIPLLMEYFSGSVEIVEKIFSNTDWSVRFNDNNYSWEIKNNLE